MPTPSNVQRRAASLLLGSVDLRHLITPDVRAQGARPLCLPFSASFAHEAMLTATTADPPEPLAAEPLWQHCVNAGLAGHEGTTLRAVTEAASNVGQPVEAVWPYNDALGSGTEPTPPTATAAPFKTADLFELPLAHDGVEDEVEVALTAGLPVVVVVEVTAEFEHPDTFGEIDVPPLSAPVNDYHAITAVGTATNPEGTARRLLIRNSWGPGWGAGGYGWLPYDYLVAFAVQAAAIDPRTLATR